MKKKAQKPFKIRVIKTAICVTYKEKMKNMKIEREKTFKNVIHFTTVTMSNFSSCRKISFKKCVKYTKVGEGEVSVVNGQWKIFKVPMGYFY